MVLKLSKAWAWAVAMMGAWVLRNGWASLRLVLSASMCKRMNDSEQKAACTSMAHRFKLRLTLHHEKCSDLLSNLLFMSLYFDSLS